MSRVDNNITFLRQKSISHPCPAGLNCEHSRQLSLSFALEARTWKYIIYIICSDSTPQFGDLSEYFPQFAAFVFALLKNLTEDSRNLSFPLNILRAKIRKKKSHSYTNTERVRVDGTVRNLDWWCFSTQLHWMGGEIKMMMKKDFSDLRFQVFFFATRLERSWKRVASQWTATYLVKQTPLRLFLLLGKYSILIIRFYQNESRKGCQIETFKCSQLR